MRTQHRFAPKKLLVGFGFAVALGGCAIGPEYQRPGVQMPANFLGAEQSGPVDNGSQPTVAANWWTLYGDPLLNDLVDATLKNNTDLQLAVARIEEAEAVLAETNSAYLPALNLDASSTRSRISTLNAQPLFAGMPVISNSHRLAISTAFELDFWGKIRNATHSARAQLLGTHYGRDVTALTLASATTQAYFTLRSLDAQIVVSQQTLVSRDDSLEVVKNRVAGGLASGLEENQAVASRADASLQLRDIQRQRALVEHHLAVLTGKLDIKIESGDVMKLPVPALPPVGLPSNLVERRPDVQQAEQDLIATNAQIGVAKAARLPTFSLTGNFGGQSKELGDIVKAGARIWSLGLNAAMPIFDAGRYSARTRQAEARHRQSLATYQKAVQTAFKEVADALTNVQLTSAAIDDLQLKVEAARNANKIAQLRYDSGYGGYLDVLDAQRTVNAAELALVQNRQQQLSFSVDLMKALGGGWTAADTSPVAKK